METPFDIMGLEDEDRDRLLDMPQSKVGTFFFLCVATLWCTLLFRDVVNGSWHRLIYPVTMLCLFLLSFHKGYGDFNRVFR